MRIIKKTTLMCLIACLLSCESNIDASITAIVKGLIYRKDNNDLVKNGQIQIGTLKDSVVNGSYYFENVPQGQQIIKITANGLKDYESVIEVKEGTQEYNFFMDILTGNVTGTVIRGDLNEPCYNCLVSIDSIKDSTDHGVYLLENVPLGQQIIKITANGLKDYESVIEVKEGTQEYNFFMDILTGNVTGTVIRGDLNEPCYNCLVSIDSIKDSTDHGVYLLENVPLGQHIIKASRNDLKDYEALIDVTEGTTVHNFVMDPVVQSPLWQNLNFQFGKIHFLTDNNAGELMAATNSGIYVSNDDGLSQWTNTLEDTIFSIFTLNKNIVYAAGYNLYISYNDGFSWTLLDTLAPEFYCNSIIVTETKRIILSISDRKNLTSGEDREIFSDDNANTWNNLSLNPIGSPKFYIGPNNILFASVDWDADADLYRSIDNGDSWSKIRNPDYIFSVFIDVNGKIYLCSDHLEVSTDNGNSWERLDAYEGENNLSWPNNIAVNAIGYIFASTGNQGKGFYRSQDNGKTWYPYHYGLEGRRPAELLHINHNGYIFITMKYNDTSLWRTITPTN